jgi:Bacteriophage Gp15 protein.
MVLDCFSALNDIELDETERTLAVLIIFYENFESIDDIIKVENEVISKLIDGFFDFIRCGNENKVTANTNYITLDWEGDAQMICSAVNKVAGTEIRALPYLHWWTFMGYFAAVGESTLSTVVAIRLKILKGKKLEKHEQEFRRENPQYFEWNHSSIQDREDDELMRQLWNNGGDV